MDTFTRLCSYYHHLIIKHIFHYPKRPCYFLLLPALGTHWCVFSLLYLPNLHVSHNYYYAMYCPLCLNNICKFILWQALVRYGWTEWECAPLIYHCISWWTFYLTLAIMNNCAVFYCFIWGALVTLNLWSYAYKATVPAN